MSAATLDWLELDAPARVVFERTPLALALCQIRYSPMLNVSNPVAVAPFQQAILEQYPVTSHEQNVQLQVEGDRSHASVQSSLSSVSWRFTDTDDSWTVVLTPDFTTLETRAYNDFSDFLDRLERVLKALTKHIRPTVGLRIGLRYINEIRPGHQDWASVIRPELLGALAVPRLAESARQSIQQIQLQGPDSIGINIQHGSIPGGTVVAPRPGTEPPDGSFYLLDIDVYQEFKPGTLTMKPGAVLGRVQQYHDLLSQLFRWSVTEAYTATLGRRTNVVD